MRRSGVCRRCSRRAARRRPRSRPGSRRRCSARCTSCCAACTPPTAERIEKLARDAPEHLYDGLLTVLMRLVFLLYAEDRDLLPSRTDAEARAFYEQGYGVRALYAQLLDDRALIPTRWTSGAAPGAGCSRCSAWSTKATAPETGFAAAAASCSIPTVYPFLQGQETAGEPPAPAPVSDGCILRILEGLMTVDGEKLSYRTLDVEQIGTVYETVMGFTVETRTGPALAIKAGKNNRTPVFVDLAALAAAKGNGAGEVPQGGGRPQRCSPTRSRKAVEAAKGPAEALEALRPIVDERGSPGGMCRRRERRSCSRPTSGAAPAATTRRAR